jgi:predicted glycosyltransferase
MDWGLGHTTRCIPIIRHILHQGHIPVFAGNQFQRSFIEETFGDIENIHLEGYNINVPGGFSSMVVQIPKILQTISSEHHWLREQAGRLNVQGIISDNRYGLFHSVIPSVIMTHQLQVQTGLGQLLNNVVQQIHYRYLNRFSSVWIVDNEDEPCLAGNLSHTEMLPKSSSYIGLLSQFDTPIDVNSANSEEYIMVLLSGAEPQRTILSGILWEQVLSYSGKVVFVEGAQNINRSRGFIPANIRYFERLTQYSLLPLLQNANTVICRSGYSTIMDLITLHKKAILIPTPGQTEQEYLANHLHHHGRFFCSKQSSFKLHKALTEIEQFPFKLNFTPADFTLFKKFVDEWIDRL